MLSFRLKKQNSKNVADTTFKLKCLYKNHFFVISPENSDYNNLIYSEPLNENKDIVV